MWATMFELDGKKPKTTFYKRLESLGLKVRATKDKYDPGETYLALKARTTPLERRESLRRYNGDDSNHTIAQEGCILTSSESLARRIAGMAREYGAVWVSVGYIELEPYAESAKDGEVRQRIENILGKRGRPKKMDIVADLTVTCHECCRTYEVHDKANEVCCDICHSPQIVTRLGTQLRYAFPPGNIIKAWARNRFASGTFEVPLDSDIDPPESVSTKHAAEGNTMKAIMNSEKFHDNIKNIEKLHGKDIAIKVLDAVLMARTYGSHTSRSEARIRSAVQLASIMEGDQFNLTESATEVDILDSASIIGWQLAANLYYEVNK